MKLEGFRAALVWTALVSGWVGKVYACGPDFPNNLLEAGDPALLQAPVADFQRELERMRLVKPKAQAVELASGQTYAEQSSEVEMKELAAALKRKHTPSELATVLLQAHLAERMKLNAFLSEERKWQRSYRNAEAMSRRGFPAEVSPGDRRDTDPAVPRPGFPEIAITPGLPREFALYFQGALAWHQREGARAGEAWERLLELPPAERHFKSTWAAFMLGKYHAAQTNEYGEEAALKYFQQTHELAASGFADSLGLAAASWGEEALLYLRRRNYERSLELYLEQFAAGDQSAVESLRFTAARAVADTNSASTPLKVLARNPRARCVITAYLISRKPYTDPREAQTIPAAKEFFERTTAWLVAVEAADVKRVECAGQLALAAYQASQIELAQRWIQRSGSEPVAQWLQAKLLLRAGNIEEAAKLLAHLSRKFPQAVSATNAPGTFADSLSVTFNDFLSERIPIGRQALGEMGVLHLARREYAEALDALLRSGYWMDAAYVAERVLSTDELKSYVDRHWKASAVGQGPQFSNDYEYRLGPIDACRRVRYLLGRRLGREARYAEARHYLPAEWQPQLEVFTAKLRESQDEKLSGPRRTYAMFDAACLLRTNGMELFGTELQPDWFIEGGNFQEGVTWQDRATNVAGARINIASDEEIGRAARHGVDPEERWHYRSRSAWLLDQAAALAWEAAESLPDNSDDTARFLCIAGTWLKNRDPEAADKFYKALVRRCRKTAIGAQADRMRWFPVLDGTGNPKPWPAPKRTSLQTEGAAEGNVTNSEGSVVVSQPSAPATYQVRAGDSVGAIAREAGVTIRAILEANPGVDYAHLRVGQAIKLPQLSAEAGRTNTAAH